jgi:hypothetical protein
MSPGVRVKYRRPWLLLLWTALTGGLYWFYWHWRINREFRDGFAMPVGPFLTLLAITVGWGLVFPPFVAWWRLLGRVEEVQRRRGVAPTIEKPVGFFLFLTLLLGPVYAQAELNRAWRRGAAGVPAAG